MACQPRVSNICRFLVSLAVSVLLTGATLIAIVRLALQSEVTTNYVKSAPLHLLSLPIQDPAQLRERVRKVPEIEPVPKVSSLEPMPQQKLTQPSLSQLKMTSFSPGLTLMGKIRVSPGRITAKGPLRGLVPLYQTPPQYPYKARQRRVEGFVELEFTITSRGTVEDIKVVRAEPRNIFERAAIAALSRWRFSPQEVDGKPIERRAIQEIRFQLGG